MRTPLLLLALMSLFTLACAPSPAERCRELELGTSMSTLPRDGGQPFVGYGVELKGPARTFMCCYTAPDDGGQQCGVACSAPENQAKPERLGGEFSGDCDSSHHPGLSHCTVWVRNDEVAATVFYCQD